jgi:hypothetical protein
MAMTKRERLIAIGVGAAVAILALDQLVIEPYFVQRDTLAQSTQKQTKQKVDDMLLLGHASLLRKTWTEIVNTGLTDDDSDAAAAAEASVLEWARAANVSLTAVKPERNSEASQFEVISFHVTGNGTTGQIANFLRSFETAKVPLRIVDLQISPVKEGIDDLTIQLSISTLCLKPGVQAAGRSNDGIAAENEAGKDLN